MDVILTETENQTKDKKSSNTYMWCLRSKRIAQLIKDKIAITLGTDYVLEAVVSAFTNAKRDY